MNLSSIKRIRAKNDCFVKTPQQIAFAFLAQNAHLSFYDSEVAAKADLSRGAANAALRALAKAGLLEMEPKGRMKFYRADLEDPRVRAYKVLLNIGGLMPVVKRAAGDCHRIVLFGSAAEGRNSPASDVDLLMVTDSPDRVRNLFSGGRKKLQLVVVTPVGLAELEKREPVFAAELKRGVVLWETS